jgi:enamine deaminase RidA (YjgF/YER057c/UK114 family)
MKVERKIINPLEWKEQFGFVQANDISGAQRLLFCSGQTSVDANSRLVHPGDMAAQIIQALDNLETVLNTAGLKLSDVVRLNYYTTDVDRFLEVYNVLAKRLSEAGCQPASTLLGVSRLAFSELLIEIEATAVV